VQIVSDAFDREVGVDRVRGGQHAAASGAAGADSVVTDLAELLLR
jgi:hypothetical protein